MRKVRLVSFFLPLFGLILAPLPPLGGAGYSLKDALLLAESLRLIKASYVEPSRIDPGAMFEASLNGIQKTVPEILVRCEKPLYCSVTAQQAVKRFPYPKEDLWGIQVRLKEVFQFIALHVDSDTKQEEIEYAAIDGLLTELDPHSNFMPPEVNEEFQVEMDGEFGGLGIVISIKDDRLTVMSPLEGTPAWKAGIKAKDYITQIDDESTVNMSTIEAVKRLRGPVGTTVQLKLEREGRSSPLSVNVTRAIINIEAVQSMRVTTPAGNSVGFIRVKSFQEHTERDFRDQLRSLLAEQNNTKGIILDLRNNPGGLLDQAVDLADEFLTSGTIVSTVGRNNALLDRDKALHNGFEKDFPLIVLVNEGSASASEILAGALKNNNRAILIGQRTFGKGSVQHIYPLPPSDAALKLTIAQYLIPGDQSIQSVGITPDIELNPWIVDRERLDIVGNIFKTEKDLEKHLVGKTATSSELAFFKLGYLEVAPEKGDKEKSEYDSKLNLEKDISAVVALGLMDGLTTGDRSLMLKEARHYLEKKQTLEEEKLKERFSQLGINWNLMGEASMPQAELSFHILKDGKKVGQARAGENITLQIRLKNVGKAPFHRLVAQSESEQFMFSNIEFAFGKIEPGESKVWESKVEIPAAMLTEDVSLMLRFQEGNNRPPSEVRLFVPVKGLKRPLFAHKYSLEDSWALDLKKGKPAVMKVIVKNQGEGNAKKPVVSIKNLGGKEIFIEKGRVPLNEIGPGKTESAELSFHIDPKWEGNELKLELSITDSELIVGTKQNITLRLAEAALEPPLKTFYSPPSIRVGALEERVFIDKQTLEGEARDDQILRDLFIFHNDQKMFYEANVKEGATLSFKTDFKLKTGPNTISVTARDNLNLVSRQFYTIYYEPTLPKSGVVQNER